jgi:hypothetical protein
MVRLFFKIEDNSFLTHLASIMHYKSNAFSKNGQPTITAKGGVSQATMGSATTMTDLDIQKVKAYYGCA